MNSQIANTDPTTVHPTTTDRPEPATAGLGPAAATTGRDDKEAAMTLTTLIDEVTLAGEDGIDLPCQVNDPELWFADTPADIEFAKTLCAACPLQAECLAGAKEREEPWGVWGGELFEHGMVIPRKRPRGRPRKHSVAA